MRHQPSEVVRVVLQTRSQWLAVMNLLLHVGLLLYNWMIRRRR